MDRESAGIGSEASTENKQYMKAPFYSKPYLYFGTGLQLIDCSENLPGTFRVSKESFFDTGLVTVPQNFLFAESVKHAFSEGISVFRGKVVSGEAMTVFQIETVCMRENRPEYTANQCVICYILNLNEAPVKESLYGGLVSEQQMAGFRKAYISIHAADGRFILAPDSIESLLGYSEAELKNMDFLSVVHPDDQHIVAGVPDQLRSGYVFQVHRYRMIHKDGSILNVESTSILIRSTSDEDTQIMNVTWDLSLQNRIVDILGQNERKYFRLMMSLPTGIALLTADGDVLEINDAMKQIMGLPAGTPVNEMNVFRIEKMKRSGIIEQLGKCISTKESIAGDISFNPEHNDRNVFLNYCFLPILGQNGDVETVLGYVNDLSHLKMVESDNRERTDFLNLVINAVKIPFFVKDEQHKWVILNDAALRMMGKSREFLLGKSDYDLYPRKQADVFWKYDEMVLQSGSSSNEEQITWSDGTLRNVITHKHLYIEKPSGRRFIVGTIHDITELKKNEDEVRSSEQKYHELFDNANDFIITLDMDGRINNANRTLLKYLQTNLESITRLNVYDFVNEKNLPLMHQMKEKLLNGELDGSFEVEALSYEKQPIIYEVKASLIHDNGNPIGAQCVFSDVTSRKEASLKVEKYTKELLELNRTKDKFFSIIAHDLRNPYSSMIGFSELLLDDLDNLSKDEIRDSLKIIRNSAKNSLNLLENLLAWTRLETGRMLFDPSRVELSSLVDEVVDVLFSLAYRKKIEINNMVSHSVVLSADKNMLNTILNNLVMNAIKFTPIGGKIVINAKTDSVNPETGVEFVRISVKDSGIGMDPALCANLFNLKKPASSPGTENEPGTGLGLILSREMVEKHGGVISVESKPGRGSEFSFLIPAFKTETTLF